MNAARYISIIVSGLAVLLMHGWALAGEPDLGAAKTLAVVPVKNGSVDQKVYRQFDRLVPELKKNSKEKIFKLEYRYSGKPERNQDVENAYLLAARIEKYLRVHHKLDLDLWISINILPLSVKSSPALTMAVFSDGIKKLDAVLVAPPLN